MIWKPLACKNSTRGPLLPAKCSKLTVAPSTVLTATMMAGHFRAASYCLLECAPYSEITFSDPQPDQVDFGQETII